MRGRRAGTTLIVATLMVASCGSGEADESLTAPSDPSASVQSLTDDVAAEGSEADLNVAAATSTTQQPTETTVRLTLPPAPTAADPPPSDETTSSDSTTTTEASTTTPPSTAPSTSPTTTTPPTTAAPTTTPPTTAPPATAPPTNGGESDQAEAASLQLLNELRSSLGLATLVASDQEMSQFARSWSLEMRQTGFRHSTARWSENIVWYSDQNMSPQQAAAQFHDMWINSPGHYRNMTNPDWTIAGVGLIRDESGWWGTHVFR